MLHPLQLPHHFLASLRRKRPGATRSPGHPLLFSLGAARLESWKMHSWYSEGLVSQPFYAQSTVILPSGLISIQSTTLRTVFSVSSKWTSSLQATLFPASVTPNTSTLMFVTASKISPHVSLLSPRQKHPSREACRHLQSKPPRMSTRERSKSRGRSGQPSGDSFFLAADAGARGTSCWSGFRGEVSDSAAGDTQ